MTRIFLICVLCCWAITAGLAQPAPLKAVGVLGNTAGLSDLPVPYAFYTGIGADIKGRLYLVGAAEGIPVCDQDGRCLAVLALPQAQGLVPNSLMVRAGDNLFFIAQHPNGLKSALYRIDTRPTDAEALSVTEVTAGNGMWALSPTLDAAGNVVVSQSDLQQHVNIITAYTPATGQASELCRIPHPQGATRPWKHTIQMEADGTFSLMHAGGANFSGRYSAQGERLGEYRDGLLIDKYRYFLSYNGSISRTDLDGKPAPGACGNGADELRLPPQMVRVGERYFFVGRGGAAEAAWDGTNFVYQRRVGALYLEDLCSVNDTLQGVAYTASGSMDVQHLITIAKTQPIGELLNVGTALHGKTVAACVPAREGVVLVYKRGAAVTIGFEGVNHQRYELALPEVQQIGQAAVQGNDILIADPKAGTIWRRPLLDKTVPVIAWKAGIGGVVAVATNATAVFIASGNQVNALSPDGNTVLWTCPVTYTGIRRLAATNDAVYVCDTLGHVVDQLDAKTGQLVASLGETGKPGSTLQGLNKPYAVAADLNGVYIADNGNGRVVVATSTLWRPEIPRLPRPDTSPLVAATIPIKPPKTGRMSVNIYDQRDVTVRQLVSAQPSAASITWDGKDMYGKWAAPGKYRYHGIIAPKLGLKYVTSIGNSGTPPYRTPDGKGSWGGVWGYVMDITPVNAEPNSDIIVLWAFEEGEGGLVRMSQDGQVRWKQHLDWWLKAQQIAVACDSESVYIVGDSAMDAPEGQSNYGGEQRRPLLWRVNAATGVKTLYAPSGQSQPMFSTYTKAARVATDLAVRDGKLYLTAQDTIFVIDAKSGKETAAWKLDGASGVAFDAQGRLYAGKGQQIVTLDAQGQVTGTFAELGGPVWDIDALPGGGFAASVGAPRQQIVYLNAQGKEVRALGKAGGRPKCGAMQPENFRDPVGLCVTGNGKLFVAESAAPKRFTRWSTDGKLEQEFNGPYYYSGMFAVDDEHPEYVYGDTHGDIIRYKVDYATGKWAVDHYWIGAYEDSGVPAKWFARIRHKDGRTFWCSGSGGIVELLPDRVRGIAAVYGGSVEKGADGNYTAVYHTKKTGLMGTWSDLNGDGKPQADEWRVTAKPAYPLGAGGPQQGWGMYFDADFTLYMHDWSDAFPGGVWKIPVAAWQNGVPVYNWEQAQHVGKTRVGNGLAHGSPGARTAFAAGDGVYGFNGGYNAAGLPGVGHGGDWEFAQITKYDPATGAPLWHAGERAAGMVAPGQHYCPTGAAGVLGDYLYWTDENSLVHVWDTKHGLYVDTLLDDTMRGPAPNAYTVWVELFNTRVFRHPQTGKAYLMAASDAIHIYEITGWEQAPVRFAGEFVLTEAGLAAARQREAARTVAGTRTLAISRAAKPVTVDGDLSEFAAASTAGLVLREQAQGQAALLYDDTNLYVAFDVDDDSPWVNAGGDTTALFKTGDTASIWLGLTAGKRQPGLGDVRILFGRNGKETVALAYRPKVAQGAKPVAFRSPAGNLVMDRVEVLADVKVVVATTPAGYRLEAAIPWAQLGGKPATGKFALDLDLNFSDPAGQRNTACLRWGRNGAAIVYDLPTEARFEPESWGIGELR